MILLVSFFLMTHAFCKSSKSYEFSICGSIAFEIRAELIDQGRELPSSWDELTSVSSIKAGRMKPDILVMEIINSFALVPGKPLIHSDAAVPLKYDGKKLVMIGRQPQVDGVKNFSGRYVIFWGPREINPDALFLEVDFIPEKVALGILAQMPEYDPASQPLAFDKALVGEVKRSNKITKDELRQSVRDWESRAEKRGIEGNSVEKNWQLGSKLVLAVTFVLIASALAVFFYGRRSRQGD